MIDYMSPSRRSTQEHVTPPTAESRLNDNLRTIVRQLEALGTGITGERAIAILACTDLTIDDVSVFVATKLDGY